MEKAQGAISRQEFAQAQAWLKASDAAIPPAIRQIMDKLLDGYNLLAHNERKDRETLLQLRLAMGFIPKTEKGCSENKPFGFG